jgi:outer membrane biosynthesis protein TonB/pSer/pThr/pTyr-binding forkhead associated (FHA) protein
MVILRDGLLVGTEVLVPGTYSLGSGTSVDVKLDDPLVAADHARIYFQNGRMAIQDRGSRSGTFVNGHPVTACEFRTQDEVVVGPFVLKARVISQKTPTGTPPEVEAMLTPANGRPNKATPAPTPDSGIPAATVPSKRRRPQEPEEEGQATQISQSDEIQALIKESRGKAGGTRTPARTPAPEAAWAFDAPNPGTRNRAKASAQPARHRSPARAHSPRHEERPHLFEVPVKGRRGRPKLFFELWWGDSRQGAHSFRLSVKKPLIAGNSPDSPLPLYGFSLPEAGMHIAEALGGKQYRLYLPPKASLEVRRKEGDFVPVDKPEQVGGRRCVTLSLGQSVMLTEGPMTAFVYVAPEAKGVFVNPLSGVPWLAVACLMLCLSPGVWWALYGPREPEAPDFTAKDLSPVAVRLMTPPKRPKVEKPKQEVKEAKADKPEAKPEPKPEPKPKKPAPKKVVAAPKPEPKAEPTPEPPKPVVFNALAKLSAKGPAMKDMLAAVDKLGGGSKTAKNTNFKLSGLIGKAPIANAGLGTFGLGSSGRNGGATLGAELLHGRGGGGIGAMGAGTVGKGHVGGTVSAASGHSISAQGNIDRDAVAKVVNSHLQEVRLCYEHELNRSGGGLAGKVSVEWTIGTTGRVAAAKVKSSTMNNASVESCILEHLKTWQFPTPKGGPVIISYPFLFNSVGF